MTPVARTLISVLASSLLLVPACQDAAETEDAVVLQQAMLEVVKPQTEVVLNTLIAALTEPPDIHVDPARLDDGDWAIMQTAATALRDEAVLLRDNPIRVTASPEDMLLGQDAPGALTPEEVQMRIDTLPELFKTHADAMREKADLWLAAIETRDEEAMWRIALDLDPVCVECHEVFWERR